LRCRSPTLKICAGALSDLSDTLKPVIRAEWRPLIRGLRFLRRQSDDGLSARRQPRPKPLGGRRHAKLDPPHRVLLLRRVAEKDDITMPELAEDLEAACGAKAAPSSISRWFIRNGYRFKKTLLASECDRPDIR
jgi:hypothetical protein